MAKALTNSEILKMWYKSTFVAILVAFGIQVITSVMQNGNENIPSEEECQRLNEQNSIRKFQSFDEFYPFYLCEHTLGKTKLFHFFATFNALAIIAVLLTRKWQWKLLLFGFVQAYTLAWISHFFIEHNRPATLTYPTYSFFGDFKMFFEIISLKYPPFL